MDDKKICIVGAKGQLGLALQKQYPQATCVDKDELDITNKSSVESFNWTGFETVINAAAYTNVDGAETPEGRQLAWSINADAVANLVAVSAQHNMTIIHVSTDYVFDGTKENHTEDEAFAPLSVYGSSKAAGDIAVSLAPKFYIVRTSWVIGNGNNFVKTMIGLAKKNISPKVVSDQVGRLTFTSELIRAIDHLLTNESPYGTYNVTNGGDSASWATITRDIFKKMGRDDLSVTDVTTDDYFADKEVFAPRPLQSTLSLDKISSTGFKSIDWTNDLSKYIESETNS